MDCYFQKLACSSHGSYCLLESMNTGISLSLCLSLSLSGCSLDGGRQAQFRMGVLQIILHRHRFSTTTDKTCPFSANQQETEIHFVFQCPVYNQLRSKYLPDIINVRDPRKHLIILMNCSPQEAILMLQNS